MTSVLKRSSGKRPKKRKFSSNRFTIPEREPLLSTSAKKFKVDPRATPVEDIASETFSGYRIVNKDLVFGHLEQYMCCPNCKNKLKVKERSTHWASSSYNVSCLKCGDISSFRNTVMIGAKKNIPEINRRFVYAMRCIGKGHAEMKTFCSVMDFPPPVAETSYRRIVKHIAVASTESATVSMKKAAATEAIQTNGCPDITVSGDGTWKTRGHSSLVGVSTIIGSESKQVIDVEVMSSFCKGCDTSKTKSGSDLQDWEVLHEKSCTKNHTGSAASMEVRGMVRMFKRSEDTRSVRYVNYIGDGDSSTFPSIVKSEPYGPTVEIEKIECVGHVQKRMGARLREIKKKMSKRKLSDGKPLGGKGRLTLARINKFSIYYGNAIREHETSVDDMRKAIWAIFFHMRSNDSEPTHNFCPVGPNSWCQYQQAVASNSVEDFHHTNNLPVAVMDTIKPIFKALSMPELLQRCLGGKTQNSNESFNALIWKLCPKASGSGREIVKIATHEAVVLCNEGNRGRARTMVRLGLVPGYHAIAAFTRSDKTRIKNAERQSKAATKEHRKAKRLFKLASEEEKIEKEGLTYAAGAF